MITSAFLLAALLATAGHPRLYYTPDDVARAKLNVGRFEWARTYFEELRAEANKLAAKSDSELKALVPEPGATFAYGISGCPECGASWPYWGTGGVTSLDAPGKATCPKCKHIFPDADHPDSGAGWKNPKDGKTYYFAGCYNARIAQEITMHWLYYLSTAYAVTGDRKYSHAAAILFDRLADVYPTCIVGSTDYPSSENSGRLERPQYQVARVLVFLANYLDLLYDSPEFAAPSASGQGSVKKHIEEAILRDGGKYCYDWAASGKMGLNNGEADYIRGTLAAGIMLDDRQWVDYVLNGPYRLENFLDNCLDRDGQYYESSVGYAEHCVWLYVDMAEMLYNYRTKEHPNGINLYQHPKLRKNMLSAPLDITCLGHMPRFGDWGPDYAKLTANTNFSLTPYMFSEHLIARGSSNKERQLLEQLRQYISDNDVESRRAGKQLGSHLPWMFFHAEQAPKLSIAPKIERHPLLGGKGIGILRSGEGVDGSAALLRYGPSHNHGHYDDLGLNYYALGREVTCDLGYDLGSAHVLVGFSKQTASHNLVVVNEKSQMLSTGGGGSALLYVDSAPVRVIEASSEASYASERVRDYRRLNALVDLPSGGAYLVDVFNVAGGSSHDQIWHFGGKLEDISGPQMGPLQEKGSLAGADIEWGSKVGAGGDIIGNADKGPYWNPPPGNGYGFLCNMKRSESLPGECCATWSYGPESGDNVKLWLLPEPNSELITAKAPGILPEYPKVDYVILRRKDKDLTSTFASVVSAYNGTPIINSVQRLKCDSSGAAGVRIEAAGVTDYIFSSSGQNPTLFHAPDREVTLRGRFAFVRVRDGNVERALLADGTSLELGGYKLTSENATCTGHITDIDYENSEIKLDIKLPKDLVGQYIYINRPGYSHNSPYRIASMGKDGSSIKLDTDMLLSRGQVGNDKPKASDAIANIVPLPRAITVTRQESNYFNGKLIINDRTSASSTITSVESDQRTVHVKDPAAFKAGDAFTVYDVQVGDEVYMPIVIKS